MKEKIHRKIYVSGYVQGVGYRHFARQHARALGVKGFVKNKADGSVYIEAEGEEQVINEFVYHCSKGPGYGKVEEIEQEDGEVKGFASFEVRM